MNYTPDIQPLSYKHRQRVFFVCLAIFIVVMPIFIFHAMGYRFDFEGVDRTIVSIGGMYIGSDTELTQLYVDDVPVVGVRLFRKASYIQNLSVGVHPVRVQGDGLYTWTKDLPVYSQIVTEANAFNLPQIPQVRPITEFITSGGNPVFIVADVATTSLFSHASTSRPIFVTERVGTSTYSRNNEYDYVVSLFASSSNATSTLLERMTQGVNSTFNFSSSLVQEAGTSTATTTKQLGESRIYESDGEVFVAWEGGNDNKPYYYCLFFTTKASTTERYGAHVTKSVLEVYEDIDEEGEWVCRNSIRIDRKHQHVEWFDFFPGTTDLVLMLLEDGLYAVEVDDRAWQNVQLLYPGISIEVVLDGDRLYVRDREHYFELFTEIFE